VLPESHQTGSFMTGSEVFVDGGLAQV
jgi:hypothetical protein